MIYGFYLPKRSCYHLSSTALTKSQDQANRNHWEQVMKMQQEIRQDLKKCESLVAEERNQRQRMVAALQVNRGLSFPVFNYFSALPVLHWRLNFLKWARYVVLKITKSFALLLCNEYQNIIWICRRVLKICASMNCYCTLL